MGPADTYSNLNSIIPLRFLWLTLLAASSAFSAYAQYASGASSLPPRYPLKAKWYYQFIVVVTLYIFIDTTNRTLYDSRPSLLIKHGGVKWLKIQNYLACQRQAADGCL
jgi:hypothetical protein